MRKRRASPKVGVTGTTPISTVEFPSSVFLSGSLKFLTVRMPPRESHVIVKAPSLPSSYSSNLKQLVLENVVIGDADFFQWISFHCKCLEWFTLRNVHVEKNSTIAIKSSSLKTLALAITCYDDLSTLDISGDKLDLLVIDNSSHRLNIFAPNLKHLQLKGKFVNNLEIGNFERLERADIYLQPTVDDKVVEIVGSLGGRAKIVCLNKKMIEALFEKGRINPEAPLNHIARLGMCLCTFSDELVPKIASLLRRVPNLDALCIYYDDSFSLWHTISDAQTFGMDMNYWKQLQKLDFVNKLSNLFVQLLGGSNEVEFVRYILECAPILKTVVVSSVRSSRDVNVEEVERKLEKSKTVANATISLRKIQSSDYIDDEMSRP